MKKHTVAIVAVAMLAGSGLVAAHDDESPKEKRAVPKMNVAPKAAVKTSTVPTAAPRADESPKETKKIVPATVKPVQPKQP